MPLPDRGRRTVVAAVAVLPLAALVPAARSQPASVRRLRGRTWVSAGRNGFAPPY